MPLFIPYSLISREFLQNQTVFDFQAPFFPCTGSTTVKLRFLKQSALNIRDCYPIHNSRFHRRFTASSLRLIINNEVQKSVAFCPFTRPGTIGVAQSEQYLGKDQIRIEHEVFRRSGRRKREQRKDQMRIEHVSIPTHAFHRFQATEGPDKDRARGRSFP